MPIDGLIIFLVILAGFWRYRVERQREIEDERVRHEMGMFGRAR